MVLCNLFCILILRSCSHSFFQGVFESLTGNATWVIVLYSLCLLMFVLRTCVLAARRSQPSGFIWAVSGCLRFRLFGSSAPFHWMIAGLIVRLYKDNISAGCTTGFSTGFSSHFSRRSDRLSSLGTCQVGLQLRKLNHFLAAVSGACAGDDR